MYAIIKESGRQFKVEEGQEVILDYREAAQGDELTFGEVLMVGGGEDGEVKLGAPLLDGASVSAEILGVAQGKKLVVQKFRRRKNSKRKNGHRQLYTKVRIGKINV